MKAVEVVSTVKEGNNLRDFTIIAQAGSWLSASVDITTVLKGSSVMT